MNAEKLNLTNSMKEFDRAKELAHQFNVRRCGN